MSGVLLIFLLILLLLFMQLPLNSVLSTDDGFFVVPEDEFSILEIMVANPLYLLKEETILRNLKVKMNCIIQTLKNWQVS